MTDLDSLLERFATRHSIHVETLPELERQAVRCTLRCLDALDADYAALSEAVLTSDKAVGVLWQLLSRCGEHVEAAITALATASGASPELIARAAVESAATIRFILQDPELRLSAYFRHYVDDVDKQVRHWRRAAASLAEPERLVHEAACDQREEANRTMRAFVEQLEEDILGSRAGSAWPGQVSERFKAIDDEVTYRTVYARLCSETHFDAEETLRFMLGRLGGDDLMQRMSIETIMFTRLMVALAVSAFLKASSDYASRYGMGNVLRECGDGLAVMEPIAEFLSEHIGARPDTGPSETHH